MKNLKFPIYVVLSFIVVLVMPDYIVAQILVHEEPLHRPVFQNDQIRILNVLLPPGDTTQYHIHHTPSVFIYFTSTTTGSQLQGSTPSTSTSAVGSIIYENLAAPNLRIHRVWNMDKATLHVMDVELLYKDTGFVEKPIGVRDLKLEIDTSWVRAYRLKVSDGKTIKLRNKNSSLLFIAINSSSIKMKQGGKTLDQNLKPGSFFEIKSRRFSLKNTNGASAHFALLEMPRK